LQKRKENNYILPAGKGQLLCLPPKAAQPSNLEQGADPSFPVDNSTRLNCFFKAAMLVQNADFFGSKRQTQPFQSAQSIRTAIMDYPLRKPPS
jgi:hypothetical protein